MRRLGAIFAIAAVAGIAMVLGLATNSIGARPAESSARASEAPLLAHYYIWFDPSSWQRAKQDLPILGPYSSDDEAVMRQHVIWAQRAGIRGFIVSWKSGDKLNSRLSQLIQIADEEGFKLEITYQGLDFDRNPLPIGQVVTDLQYFADNFAANPAFDLFSKPIVVLTGTPQYTRDDLEKLQPLRSSLSILASDKNPADYESISDLVDGNLYYWSSADPIGDSGYATKLDAFSSAVHANGGLWIAPAAPGFDATLLGGTRTVPRRDGETLKRSLAAAAQSRPDAIGLISWNEFSENTFVEPSQANGASYLDVVSQVEGMTPPKLEMDSSSQSSHGYPYGLVTLGLLAIAIVVSIVVVVRRSRT